MKQASENAGLRGAASEALFRATVVAFSRRFWNVRLREGNRIPEGPCFIYGNHSNNYDPFILNALTPRGRSTAGVMTMEYLEGHVLSPLFSAVGILGTRKDVPEPHLVRRIFRLLDEGRSVVIYPEGGRRWSGRPLPWIESTAKLFRAAGVPVYPVVTHGSYVGWPRWARYPRPARIEIEVLPPFRFDRSRPIDEMLTELMRPIAADENLVEDRIRPRSAFRTASGIERLLYRDPHSGRSGGIVVAGPDRIHARDAGWTARVLPDSRIQRDDTGEILLTGDLYDVIRRLPSAVAPGAPHVSNEVVVSGRTDDETFFEKRLAASLYDSHISLSGLKSYHVPLENVRHVTTERSSKLYVALTSGHLSLRFPYGGSPLEWYDMLRFAISQA